ncbi:cation diffusion facilitator family transporter [Pasteurella bettyae]|uniref:Cation-efflux pump FieF n=1 Tax=Pasteurella bettyae CCUG 2042 TaxID=1095749 RepID=I3D688_9PAST|nr:cation diffusion facilitator family transporter [Pasteurella bettyae]EIJ67231.1 ferrous iron efflux protein F [Pasteurella bettyae CCUG 2042]SUB21233.1 cation-efflux pump FieF [Pasteurella bettyae]
MSSQYSDLVKRASFAAIFTAITLIVVKLFAWWQTGSVSMLASITDSTLDLLASFTSLLILRFALMPADHNHSFGHGKAESLASMAQGAFITGSAFFLLLQGIHRLNNPMPVENTGIGISITMFSVVITFILVLYQGRVIRFTDSPAIKADQLHYQTDLVMNAAILISLLLGYLGFNSADAIFAILIAIYICINGAKMMFDAVQLLLDLALPDEEIKQIEQLIMQDKRILGFHDLRTRRAGEVRFIQMHLELDDHLSFLQAHEITEKLESRLEQAFPTVEVVIHHEPTSIVQAEKKMM